MFMVCRCVDDQHYYSFQISPEGFYVIYKLEGGEGVQETAQGFSEEI